MRHPAIPCVVLLFLVPACSTPPELMGYPANTPSYYTENKLFYVTEEAQPPPAEGEARPDTVTLRHVYEVGESDAIKHGDALAVVLQGVRLPEDLGGRRDIAVILDILTSSSAGLQSMVAFYQRDVPGGQMLNFSNLLVYADPQWDSATPPYFRVRVLDVKAERNRRTEAMLRSASKLGGEISGLIPHPIIPVVMRAIEAAGAVLSNQRNVVLMDFQMQLYGAVQRAKAGAAVLPALRKGPWVILGRRRDADAEFWKTALRLERRSDRIVDVGSRNVPVPYVKIAMLNANVQVPKLVMERSEALIKLLSSPTGKSDVDALDAAADVLASSVRAFTSERRLMKYRSKMDLKAIIDLLDEHQTRLADGGVALLSPHAVRRLIDVVNKATGLDHTSIKEIKDWWNGKAKNGKFVPKADAPLGVIWEVPDGT